MKLNVDTAVTAVKFAVSGIVGIGTTKIVRTIIDNNIEPETTKDKVTVGAASIVVGMAAADYTKSYTDTTIDEIVNFARTLGKAKDNLITEDTQP